MTPGDDVDGGDLVIGSVGEIDPAVATRFGLTRTTGNATAARRIGWLEVDLGLLFDEIRVPRRQVVGGAVSRFPSSDIDLAFVVDDRYRGRRRGGHACASAAGDLLESVRLFDVYRGTGIAEGARSLAYRLRFCSPVRTLTDEEVGDAARPMHRGGRGGVRRRPALTPRARPVGTAHVPPPRGKVAAWRYG